MSDRAAAEASIRKIGGAAGVCRCNSGVEGEIGVGTRTTWKGGFWEGLDSAVVTLWAFLRVAAC